MAEEGIPLIEECNNLLCDTRTLAIWGATAFCLLLVSLCLCWNCYIHWKADRETDVPAFLQNIREQQAKYKRMNLKVLSFLSHHVLYCAESFWQPTAQVFHDFIECSFRLFSIL